MTKKEYENNIKFLIERYENELEVIKQKITNKRAKRAELKEPAIIQNRFKSLYVNLTININNLTGNMSRLKKVILDLQRLLGE